MFGFHSNPLDKISKEDQLQKLQRVIAGDESADIKAERDHVIFNAGVCFGLTRYHPMKKALNWLINYISAKKRKGY